MKNLFYTLPVLLLLILLQGCENTEKNNDVVRQAMPSKAGMNAIYAA